VTKKTHYMRVHNKEFLGNWDLVDSDGKDVELKVVVSHVESKTIIGEAGRESDCNVAYFTDKKVKPLILNREAEDRVAEFTGSNFIEDWGGCALQLWVMPNARLMSGGKGRAVRIRTTQPRTEFPELDKDHKRFGALCKAYATKGEGALTAARKGFTISDETVKLIKSRAEDLKADPA